MHWNWHGMSRDERARSPSGLREPGPLEGLREPGHPRGLREPGKGNVYMKLVYIPAVRPVSGGPYNVIIRIQELFP